MNAPRSLVDASRSQEWYWYLRYAAAAVVVVAAIGDAVAVGSFDSPRCPPDCLLLYWCNIRR